MHVPASAWVLRRNRAPTPDGRRLERQWRPACRSPSRPTLAGKNHGELYIIRIDVEEAADEYLALPYPVDGLDRLLADMPKAAEMFAFADGMQPRLKQKLSTVLSWRWKLPLPRHRRERPLARNGAMGRDWTATAGARP